MRQTKADIILEYCESAKCPVTVKGILIARFPGKPQPDIYSIINQLVAAKKLIRDDSGTSCTVRGPQGGEVVPELRNYSRVNRKISRSDNIKRKEASTLPEDIKNSFNEFWLGSFNNRQDYYSKMPPNKLVRLKMIVSKINNLISYESTLMSASMISDVLRLSDTECAIVERRIRSSSINTNGYDIEYCGSYSRKDGQRKSHRKISCS